MTMDLWLDRERGLRLNPAGVEALAQDILGCPDVNDLHDYLDGSDEVIGAEGMREVEAHIKTCPRCREEVRLDREHKAFLGTARGRSYIEDLRRRVQEKVRAEESQSEEKVHGEIRIGDETHELVRVEGNLFQVRGGTIRNFDRELQQAKGQGQLRVVEPTGEEVVVDLYNLQMVQRPVHSRLAAASPGAKQNEPSNEGLKPFFVSDQVEVLYDARGSIFLRVKSGL